MTALARTSSMKCVVSTMARPLLYLRMTSHVMRRECGSMPEVGSSKNTTWIVVCERERE